jgi:SAM-dependent methyltransferase
MEDLNKTTYFYRVKFKSKEAKFNVPGKLSDYFGPMIGEKKEVKIAELGAGPVNTIGNEWPGVEVLIYASDVFASEYITFWEKSGKSPLVPVVYEDMEHLTYPDEMFDIVHCRNAVDHTPNPLKAIEEMKRVCKKGGWVYMAHAPGQKTRYGGMHSVDYENLVLPEFTRSMDGELIVDVWHKI